MLPKSKSAPRPPDGFDSAQRCLPAYSRSAGPGRSAGVIAAVAGWSARHRALAIGGWLALVVVAVLSSSLVRGDSARSVDPGRQVGPSRWWTRRAVAAPSGRTC